MWLFYASERVEAVPRPSSEGVRDTNRRIVLNLIRTRQPISRADLARASGLQRSTISLIVEQLIEENWVLEGATGRLPRGRRPTFLRLNDDRVIIGVDIRPIQITVALADANGKFTSREVMPTPTHPKVALADQGDSRAGKALDTMARYLGRGMRMIVAGLAPERIVVVGDLTRSWQRFGRVIENEFQAQVLRGGVAPQLVPAFEDGMARLRGTVALVLQKHFSA